jgi:hypothetical protein
LEGGTEKTYGCGRFSPDGSKLATVGGYPDFWLTVWDWATESIVLRSKAFSQDVFDVTFSNFFEGQLLTSGTGHIRFWKMAETFTGLKLQGDIGRFGQEDLSDIAGYAELPDGKVLSGTESGRMLLWDGALIKAVILRSPVATDEKASSKSESGRPCHDGMIEFVRLDAALGVFFTAGADGYVRTWDFTAINEADPDEDTVCVIVDPLKEFPILKDSGRPELGLTSVKSVVDDGARPLARAGRRGRDHARGVGRVGEGAERRVATDHAVPRGRHHRPGGERHERPRGDDRRGRHRARVRVRRAARGVPVSLFRAGDGAAPRVAED